MVLNQHPFNGIIKTKDYETNSIIIYKLDYRIRNNRIST